MDWLVQVLGGQGKKRHNRSKYELASGLQHFHLVI